jgi:predicted kinase
MAKIIVLCGIPASGKSTWTKNHIANNSWDTKSISRDDIRDKYFQQPYIYTKESEAQVTEFFNNKLQYCLEKGFNVILDNCHCREKYLDQFLSSPIFNLNTHTLYIKFFDIPLWKAYYRTIVRKFKTGKDVPLKIIHDMHRNYKKINREKYYKKAIIL